MNYSKEERNRVLEDWRQSGKSAFTYAKENGPNLKTLKNWIKAEREVKQNFVEIPSKSAYKHLMKTTNSMPAILIEKGEIRIQIPITIGHADLRAIIEGLGITL